MAHWTMERVDRAKNKIIDAIDQDFELEEIRKKIRKDSRKMDRNHLIQKYQNKYLVDEALKESANVG
jgi:hypothetical protein